MASPYQVSCHCGQIRLEITAELGEVVECNCSICSRLGFLHWYVAPEQVTLLTEKRQLDTYIWRSATPVRRQARASVDRSAPTLKARSRCCRWHRARSCAAFLAVAC